MSDQFAAQLRQHLLESANERPADGQLAAVVAHVAATNQRRSIVAVLADPPARLGPSRTMGYGFVAGALLVALVAALLGGGSASIHTPASPGTSPTTVAASPGATTGPAATPASAECQGFAPLTAGGQYGARLGSLFVAMDVPDTLAPWQGRPDAFDVSNSCARAHPIEILATVVTTMYPDACHPEASGVAVSSQADAVRQFTAQVGRDLQGSLKPDLLNGYSVARYMISASDACSTFQLWNGVGGDDHGSMFVYLVDVDGVPLGILVRLGANNSQYEQDAATRMVESLHVTSRLAAVATNPPFVPACIEFDSSGTYTARAGAMPLSLRVAGAPGSAWYGQRDYFYLGRATCAASGGEPVHLIVDAIQFVYGDACRARTSAVSVTSAAEAVAEVIKQTGHPTTGPIHATLGSYPATRFDMGPPDGDPSSCDGGGMRLWDGVSLVGGMEAYVIEVDGIVYGVTATFDTSRVTAADREQADAILQTLRVGP